MRHGRSTFYIMVALLIGVATAMRPAIAGAASDITVANLNILHGFNCALFPAVPMDESQCRVGERIDLLLQHIVDAGCPDVVTLQENVLSPFVVLDLLGTVVGPVANTVALIGAGLPALAQECGFTYEMILGPGALSGPPPRSIDEELILSRYPVMAVEETLLDTPFSPFFTRHAVLARIDHPSGPTDVITTHLSSSQDLGLLPCGAPFPPGLPIPFPAPSCPAGPAGCISFPNLDFDSWRDCQAKQLSLFVELRHNIAYPAFVTGDFNAEPFSSTYEVFADLGWIDSHLAAGNSECNSSTGENCTSGRESQDLSNLESSALNLDHRIDYIFVIPAAAEGTCDSVIKKSHGHKRLATGPFAAEPNPFVDQCGALPSAICWPSDHSGNMATLMCDDEPD